MSIMPDLHHQFSFCQSLVFVLEHIIIEEKGIKKNRTTMRFLNIHSYNGAPDTIRTYGLQFRKLSLYPAELRARNTTHFIMGMRGVQGIRQSSQFKRKLLSNDYHSQPTR